MTRSGLDADDATTLAFQTAAAFVGEYVPLAYILEPIVRTSALYTLTARTGSGKTALAIIAALAVATGRSDILGMPVEPGRIAYLSFENPDDLRMRLAVAAHHLNVNLDTLGDRFVILDEREPPEEIWRSLDAMAAVGGQFALIVVDTLAAAFDGRDINDNVESGNFVRRLRPLTMLPGLPAVIVAAHPTKNASDDQLVPYVGGAILNEVDGNLTLAKRPDATHTTLHWSGKFRGLEFVPFVFEFVTESAPAIIDKHGRPVPLPILRPTNDAMRAAAENSSADVDLAILRCLDQDPPLATRAIGEAVGRTKSAVEKRLKRLRVQKLVDQQADNRRWHLTAEGKAATA